MPQILNEIVEVVKAVKNVPRERISEGIGVQIVDAPVSHSQPQILKEVVEVVKAVKIPFRSVFLGRLVNRSTTTLFPSINQVTKFAATHRPVVLQRQVPQLQTVAKTLEVSPVPFVNRVVKAPVIMQINQVTKHDAVSQIRHTNKERQEQMAAVPANGVRRPNMKQCARLKPCPGHGHRC